MGVVVQVDECCAGEAGPTATVDRYWPSVQSGEGGLVDSGS